MARIELTENDIFKIDRASNFTQTSLGDLGYECVEEPVSKMGVNILLDCIKVELFGCSGVMYSGYYSIRFKNIHYRQIAAYDDCFITVISMLSVNDTFKRQLAESGLQVMQIQSRSLVVLYEEDLIRLRCLIKPVNVFIPKVRNPVLFSRIVYEDVYLLRFREKCRINALTLPKNWSAQRRDMFYISVQYLQGVHDKIVGWR